MKAPKYSVVVPVYNRPEELDELLNSLCQQTFDDFEVIVVEDGSSISSKSVVEKYQSQLAVQYLTKPNSGPGPSRNVGFQNARGEYFVVFDSDCILPSSYLKSVETFLLTHKVDAWGGPDRGHDQFTALQRAMAHTMSSFFTTGGIRGGAKMVGNYQPRSFNMGMSRSVFQATGGFKFDRYAEDIELSIRLRKAGFTIAYIADAFVFHKRRATLHQFFQQVYNFGKGRAQVGFAHRGEVKWMHWFPSIFTVGLLSIIPIYFLLPKVAFAIGAIYLVYASLVVGDGFYKTKNAIVAMQSLPSLFVQLTGYGIGFFVEKVKLLQRRNSA